MKKPYLIAFACAVLLLSIFLLIKRNVTLYIGDYSGNTRYVFDIIIKIDGKEILNDSLTSSFPYMANFVIKENLRCGFHKINVYSDRANVNQEKRIFLFPNQFITIDFFPADTLTFRQYHFPDSIIMNGVRLTDSIIEQYKLPAHSYNQIFQDTLDFPIITEKSNFDIRTGFNPFYYE
jgi:hypothetical protein